jgi:hypothetical protein
MFRYPARSFRGWSQARCEGSYFPHPPLGTRLSCGLIRQIKAFQHVHATGEVTPSGWEPGATTLTPGPDLIGRVWEVWKP